MSISLGICPKGSGSAACSSLQSSSQRLETSTRACFLHICCMPQAPLKQELRTRTFHAPVPRTSSSSTTLLRLQTPSLWQTACSRATWALASHPGIAVSISADCCKLMKQCCRLSQPTHACHAFGFHKFFMRSVVLNFLHDVWDSLNIDQLS